ncbi:hypothetical protein MON38_10240 [Hymenobacter sp. DH14]|uniref:Uncharacterized protein n=1 Tax=Hymenobacter cyanobacteriorum TaxID=2926463 RepID=A0A9X1VEQ4_9BACT|nr:hypothetical protein [Hymenobacter cyanobacteriorum]MCI1187799.1 hypothetical protein [Hymenobacter cyanobacteriorum]
MSHEPENLNTEPNDIAGNRIDGPEGNTATQHTAPGAGVGQPGGVPNQPGSAGQATTPVSSESLAASETSPGQGAVGPEGKPQENKEAAPAAVNPANPAAGATYGGNFGNGTQDSYHDQRRRENQDSDANRGEFGVESQQGTTHGGFGNQNRVADYEPRNSAEDQYYGGPGAPGVQANAYRAYDGQDARPDARTEYGFERGTAPAATGGEPATAPTAQRGDLGSPAGDNRNQPDRADAASAHQVDNGSRQGPDSGFAADYGHTSLPGAGTGPASAQPVAEHRNQTEDYLPTPSDTDSQGRATAPATAADARGTQPAGSEGYGDRGRNEPNAAPDFQTGGERNGYTQPQANNGDAGQGVGSRGGSYNDAYDDSKPGSNAGSPAAGDQRREDRDANYGTAAREENRASGEENEADHGAPRRNEGRE